VSLVWVPVRTFSVTLEIKTIEERRQDQNYLFRHLGFQEQKPQLRKFVLYSSPSADGLIFEFPLSSTFGTLIV
jgi:hypothetical protein